jgi:hypothetical protein
MGSDLEGSDWLAVIGRALAQISLSVNNLNDKTTAEKAGYLEALGVGRKDVAAMLGTSVASVTELLRQARNKKSPPKAKSAKKAR